MPAPRLVFLSGQVAWNAEGDWSASDHGAQVGQIVTTRLASTLAGVQTLFDPRYLVVIDVITWTA